MLKRANAESAREERTLGRRSSKGACVPPYLDLADHGKIL